MTSGSYPGSRKSKPKPKPNYRCAECGHRDIVSVRGSLSVGADRAMKLAACPKCGERDPDALKSFWLGAGLTIAAPFIALLLVGLVVVSSTLLKLVCILVGALASYVVYKKGVQARLKQVDGGVTFDSRMRAQLEYATGRTKDRPVVE